MPIINKDFLEKYQFYKRDINQPLLTNFLLGSISSLFITIMEVFASASLKTMGLEFVKLIFDKIVTFEKKLTKFDNRLMIGKYKSNIDTSSEQFVGPDNGDQDEQDEQDGQDGQDGQDDQGDQDIFSIGDMDVELDDEDNLYNDIQDKLN